MMPQPICLSWVDLFPVSIRLLDRQLKKIEERDVTEDESDTNDKLNGIEEMLKTIKLGFLIEHWTKLSRLT
jgi:hypothetical protein